MWYKLHITYELNLLFDIFLPYFTMVITTLLLTSFTLHWFTFNVFVFNYSINHSWSFADCTKGYYSFCFVSSSTFAIKQSPYRKNDNHPRCFSKVWIRIEGSEKSFGGESLLSAVRRRLTHHSPMRKLTSFIYIITTQGNS